VICVRAAVVDNDNDNGTQRNATTERPNERPFNIYFPTSPPHSRPVPVTQNRNHHPKYKVNNNQQPTTNNQQQKLLTHPPNHSPTVMSLVHISLRDFHIFPLYPPLTYNIFPYADTYTYTAPPSAVRHHSPQQHNNSTRKQQLTLGND